MSKILIVEDEHRIARFLQMELEHEGFSTASESNGLRAYERIIQEDYDLVLLDIMLPDMDGLTICQNVRKLSDIPIIMLTARGSEYDKITGLDNGADDYVTKPFGVMELIARIKAVLRRSAKINVAQDKATNDLSASNGLLVLNHDFHKVYVNNEEVILTLKEFELLYYLLKNKNIVISRDKIMDEVWDYNYAAETRTVDVHIKTLRHKLGVASKLIETIRGVGYKIID